MREIAETQAGMHRKVLTVYREMADRAFQVWFNGKGVPQTAPPTHKVFVTEDGNLIHKIGLEGTPFYMELMIPQNMWKELTPEETQKILADGDVEEVVANQSVQPPKRKPDAKVMMPAGGPTGYVSPTCPLHFTIKTKSVVSPYESFINNRESVATCTTSPEGQQAVRDWLDLLPVENRKMGCPYNDKHEDVFDRVEIGREANVAWQGQFAIMANVWRKTLGDMPTTVTFKAEVNDKALYLMAYCEDTQQAFVMEMPPDCWRYCDGPDTPKPSEN